MALFLSAQHVPLRIRGCILFKDPKTPYYILRKNIWIIKEVLKSLDPMEMCKYPLGGFWISPFLCVTKITHMRDPLTTDTIHCRYRTVENVIDNSL